MNHRCPPSLTLLPILAAVGLGCTGAPNPTTGSPQPAPRPAAGAGDLVTAAVGAFRLTIDPSAGTAAFTPVHGRTAQQSELYNLSIEHFMRPGTLTVTGVGLDADTLWVDYAATHPFPKAANLSGPPTATNREDLAVSGRILFLIDDGTEYFGGNVTANTALVTNADGYFQPGDLITDPGLAADTFPYKLLVDEAADNRVGLPNGGPTGNYTPAAGGWQVPEFTAGITGYDIWAQGQAATGRLELDRPTLEALGPVAIDTVIVVKYEDPRGGSTGSERRANRLPQNDPLKFAYRMPHGALDVGKVSYAGETGGLVANTDSATTVRFTVRDWDAFATPAGQTNLAGIADVSLVSQGEPGLPKVEVSIPAVLGDVLAELGHVDNGATGHAGSELLYEGAVPNLGTGQSPSGELATGLARAIDIVDRTPPPQWANVNRFNLSPDLIPFTPVTEGITYQRFAVAIAGSPTVFGCNFPLPPKTVPDFTTPFSVATRVTWNTYLNPPHPTWDQFTFKALDTGASLDPAHPGIILQGKALTVADKTDFYRFAPATPDSFTAERLTDWTATPQNQAFDVEVDAANRVFFLTLGPPFVTQSTPGLIFSRANPDIKYFDITPGTPVAIPPSLIPTGAGENIPLALTLDPLGDVYTIDKGHRLRKYVKANNYAELDNQTYPILLPLGPPMGPAGDAATRNIHDFVIDYHNAAFFILAQSNEIPTVTGNGNGYLYRIECDGTFSALTPQGNPNPLRLILNEAFQNNGTADITIDQHNAAGGLLGSAADVQMVVVSHTGFGNTEPDLRILSSELTWNPSAALDFQDGSISDPAYAPGTATMDPLTNRLVVQPENCDACYHWYNAPPGWQ